MINVLSLWIGYLFTHVNQSKSHHKICLKLCLGIHPNSKHSNIHNVECRYINVRHFDCTCQCRGFPPHVYVACQFFVTESHPKVTYYHCHIVGFWCHVIFLHLLINSSNIFILFYWKITHIGCLVTQILCPTINFY